MSGKHRRGLKVGEPSMNGQDHAPGEKSATLSQGAAPISEPGNGIPAKPATAQQLEQTEIRIEERMSGFERSMIRLTRAGVIIAVVTGFIFAGQLYEMYEGGTATDKLVQYAQTQSGAATKMATASEKFSTTSETAVTEFKKAAAESTKAAKEGVASTKTSIENSQEAFRDDQRAWVGVGDVTVLQFDENKLKVQINLSNSGKTPALKVRRSARFAHASISVPSTVKCSSLSKPPDRACFTTACKNFCEISPASSRSRFLVNTVTSHTASSISSPTNQRNSRL